jgi:hypothetical protein
MAKAGMIGAVTASNTIQRPGSQALRNTNGSAMWPIPRFDVEDRLFVSFSDDRWLYILVPIVVLFVFGFIIVVRVSRRHRLA